MNQIAPHSSPAFADDNLPAVPVTVAYGDGIGPEIMSACLRVLMAAGARLDIRKIEVGERLYRTGETSGIGRDAWESLRETGLFYKAPITTPQGSGMKSLNVTVRKTLGLFANVRPVQAYAPYVPTRHPGMDVVIIRENEEDLYAGIEHQQTDEVVQCLKLISRPGCERIVRYAFDYARANGRRKVTCFSKDNIMKLTDGLFHRVFDEIAADYPDIESEHMIIDIGAAKLANEPGRFDVIVTANLYGDIVSDIAAEVAGSVGMAPSANIGARVAMFEAVHGSAPDIAGKGIANPSGLLMAGAMLLSHIGQHRAAEAVRNAWLKTIEDGLHTGDIHVEGQSRDRLGAEAFADSVIDRLGDRPQRLPAVSLTGSPARILVMPPVPRKPARKTLLGVDVFVHAAGAVPEQLAESLRAVQGDRVNLTMISNRGVKVWPKGMPETSLTDHWRCRFKVLPGQQMQAGCIAALLMRLADAGIETVKTENLYSFDGVPGFSLGQGE